MDDAGKDSENAAAALAILNAKHELGYIKGDGSLNDGFELVLHPMTLDFHLSDEMPWKQVLDCLRKMGYYSHLGVSPEDVAALLDAGYCEEDVEELLDDPRQLRRILRAAYSV